jgi:Asp-tRNA(Asn)/Glu-tRNA(Gln) amidotransferase A subunit family amidase
VVFYYLKLIDFFSEITIVRYRDLLFITPLMTIPDYCNQIDKKVKFDEIIAHAKSINTSNPAILRREDQHIQSCQDNAFTKPLAGLPIVIKDNILLENTVSSCGSKMLEHYIAPYTSTVVRRLEDAGAIVIGKATMDEFALGTTGENSPFPVPYSPYGVDRVAGGTSS